MILVTIEAETLKELRAKMRAMLEYETEAYEAPIVTAKGTVVTAAERRKMEAREKLRAGSVKVVETPEPDEVVVSVPGLDPEPDYPSFVNDRTEPEYVEVPVPNSKADPVAMEKLKQETVAKLPDMFAAGKVNLMRAVLTKYGKGAKSFPEIEAKDFPEIAAALARGDGS